MTDKRYGKWSKESDYPVADWLYGHRLMIGQHWMEYTLEFLNVMAGFEYQLGQGIDLVDGKQDFTANPKEYKVPGRFGLRRFVFCDYGDSKVCPTDRSALHILEDKLTKEHIDYVGGDNKQALEQVRYLLRSFTAIETGRSWFARSLFPVHDSFLLFESRRVTNKNIAKLNNGNKPTDHDVGMRTSDRNFYARGGEIYYLMLSAGTHSLAERREFISTQLKNLMMREESLGKLAQLVDSAWEHENERPSSLGWLPDKDCVSYQLAAEDMWVFLHNNIDQSHAIELLSHLIGFHLIQMLYRRTNQLSHNSFTMINGTNDPFKPKIPVDCVPTSANRAIRDISMSFFKAQGDNQEKAVRVYLRGLILSWVNKFLTEIVNGEKLERLNSAQTQMLLQELYNSSYAQFNIKQLHSGQKALFQNKYESIKSNTLLAPEKVELFINVLTTTQLDRFRKTTMGIHGKIGRGIGLIAPKIGKSARYVLTTTLTEALVVANIEPGNGGVEFVRFIEILYQRYGLIIGPVQARQSELLEYRQIDRQFYKENELAFRRQLLSAGLLTEFSDATAIVINPFEAVKANTTVLR